MSKLPRVAVLGATGAVGQEFIRLFEERNFQFASLKLLASKRSAGKKLMVCGKEYTVEEAKPESFENIDVALFAGGSISKTLAPEAAKRGAVVIDNSSTFRIDRKYRSSFRRSIRRILQSTKASSPIRTAPPSLC